MQLTATMFLLGLVVRPNDIDSRTRGAVGSKEGWGRIGRLFRIAL
jgi:hypothetical protein